MQFTKQLLLITTVLFITSYIYAQDAPVEEEIVVEKNLDNGTIAEQFDYVIKKSNRYEDYKVIKQEWINTLKSHVVDSLILMMNELKSTEKIVIKQRKEIGSLKTDIKTTTTSLGSVSAERDNIVFMGSQMTKGGYKTMMWGIVFVLMAALLFFIYKFNNSNSVTAQAKASLSDTLLEFDEFRKNMRLKEQKLKRELQDEINKHL